MTGAMGGAFTSAYLSGSLGDMTGVSTRQAFSGGVLLMLGARIAGGCTRYVAWGRHSRGMYMVGGFGHT